MSVMAHVILSLLLLATLMQTGATEPPSDVSPRQCSVSCELESDIHHYGFDANKDQVLVDLKRCVKVYISPTGTTNCSPSTDNDSCQRECSPRSYWLESHSNRTGPFMVKTVRKCYATTHHCQTCQRKPNRVYVFTGSKYQRGIDVGRCSGVCDDVEMGSGEEGIGESATESTDSSSSCLPTRTRTVSVEGPNGYITLEVIDNCSCVSQKCYRADHFQSVSVVTDNKRREELVNIGKCIGRCSGVYINPRCVQFSPQGLCIWYLPGTAGKCRPTTASSFPYTDIYGVNKTLPIVEDCGCTTG